MANSASRSPPMFFLLRVLRRCGGSPPFSFAGGDSVTARKLERRHIEECETSARAPTNEPKARVCTCRPTCKRSKTREAGRVGRRRRVTKRIQGKGGKEVHYTNPNFRVGISCSCVFIYFWFYYGCSTHCVSKKNAATRCSITCMKLGLN